MWLMKIVDWPLDDLDCLIILAIGETGNRGGGIHKMVIRLSKSLGIKIDPEAYELGYSETVAERLHSRSHIGFFIKVGDKYQLTERGKALYYKLLGQLREKNRVDVIEMLRRHP